MAGPLDPLFEQLQLAGLMTVDESRGWLYRLPPERRPADPMGLAYALVEAAKLTTFQAEELLAGRGRMLLLGDYTLQERLGVGAMGQVFRARHRKMNRVVALKILQPSLARSPDMTLRFQREVQAAARLIHPNIVAALDASEHEGLHFLVMEYVEGCDLAKLLKQQGALRATQAIDYILQAARGLEHAHAEGIVHRDIKPSNLLVDKRGVVKILDLGAARMESAWGEPLPEDDEGLTYTGNILGTVDYMAPEQAMNLRHADSRADIYSLGCTLFRLLTNQRLYSGESVLERILAHRESTIPRLRDHRPELPQALEGLFARMVAKRPEDRYATASDLIHDLEAIRASLPAEVEPTANVTAQEVADSEQEASQDLETVWSDAPLEAHAEDDPITTEIAVQPTVSSLEDSMSQRGERPPTPAWADPVVTPPTVTPMPTAAPIAWAIVTGAALLPVLILAFLPASESAPPARKESELDRVRREERVADDAQISDRALDRMRRDVDQFNQQWQQSQSRRQSELDDSLNRASQAGAGRPLDDRGPFSHQPRVEIERVP